MQQRSTMDDSAPTPGLPNAITHPRRLAAWAERLDRRLDEVRSQNRWRTIRTLDGTGPHFELNGQPVTSFASNDYLGLASHPEVRRAASAAAMKLGTGAGASRLVVGSRYVHDELELELAEWKGAERALLFPTGYAANVGMLTALADSAEVLIISDELNHASIIDGARLSRGTVAIARHRDPDHVRKLLQDHHGPAVVVTDAVFSMDGDVAPIDDLKTICARYGALLILDEAHAVLEPPAMDSGTVVHVGTLSKTLGSLGGFVAGPSRVIDLLINVARPFIFSTAPSPPDTAAALTALRIVRSDEGRALITRLRAHVERVAGSAHPSPIVPVLFGGEAETLHAADELLSSGMLVPAIRPPTVPPGTSRLRIALSAAHETAEVEHLVSALARFR